MKFSFFDFEVTPNYWLCVFGLEPNDWKTFDESIKDTFIVVDSDMDNARDKLLALLRQVDYVQCGYNIKGYDLIIANAIYQGFTPDQVHIISDMIINPSLSYSSPEHLRLSPFAKKRMRGLCYQDLFDDNEGSLKEKEAILGMDIRESNVPFDKPDLTAEDKADLIFYCKHDVYAAMYYYYYVAKNYVDTKLAVGKKFGIDEKDCYVSTNANLVSKVLKAKRSTFIDADKIEIKLPPQIEKYCYDNLPAELVDRIRTSVDNFEIKLFDNVVSFGNGGVHSVLCNNLYVESDDDWMLMNLDAASYYPSMLIFFLCLSRAVENPLIFREIFNERLDLKAKEHLTPEEEILVAALKLILNTTYGASGNKWLDLYDPYMCTRCCRIGQIFLAALANKLVKYVPHLKVIQTNTDGILLYFRRIDLELVRRIAKEWTDISCIKTEEDFVDKIWQRDVNNYLLVKEGGKRKTKGGWLMDTWKKKGLIKVSPLTAFVSAKAVTSYLLEGKDIVKSILANNNIEDFALTCKKGPTFRGVVQRFADGSETELFKCNRVMATKDKNAGMLYKYKVVKGVTSYNKMPNVPEHCYLLNCALVTYDFNELKKQIDYMFYIERAADLLDIAWLQLKATNVQATHQFDYFN